MCECVYVWVATSPNKWEEYVVICCWCSEDSFCFCLLYHSVSEHPSLWMCWNEFDVILPSWLSVAGRLGLKSLFGIFMKRVSEVKNLFCLERHTVSNCAFDCLFSGRWRQACSGEGNRRWEEGEDYFCLEWRKEGFLTGFQSLYPSFQSITENAEPTLLLHTLRFCLFAEYCVSIVLHLCRHSRGTATGESTHPCYDCLAVIVAKHAANIALFLSPTAQ